MDIASSLPKVLNLNPRSIYNKAENLKQFVKEREIDIVCIVKVGLALRILLRVSYRWMILTLSQTLMSEKRLVGNLQSWSTISSSEWKIQTRLLLQSLGELNVFGQYSHLEI